MGGSSTSILPSNVTISGIGGSEGFSTVRTRRFSARFENGLWVIRFEGHAGGVDYEEIGTDGTNIFSVISTESRFLRASQSGHPVVNNSQGAIRRGPVPHEGAHSHVGMLWLALASNHYIQTNGTDLLPPITLAEMNSDILLYFGFRQRAIVEAWNSLELRPKRVVWFHDGIIRYWESVNFSWVSKHIEKKWKPPYDSGFTNAVFEASQPMQLEQFSLPTRLDYWVYSPRPMGTTNTDLITPQHHWLQVTNASLRTLGTSCVPQKPLGIMLVNDERFAAQEGKFISVNYAQTNNWIGDDEAIQYISDPLIQKRIRLMADGFRQSNGDVRKKPVSTIPAKIMLLCLIALPFAWLFVWRKIESNKQKNNEGTNLI